MTDLVHDVQQLLKQLIVKVAAPVEVQPFEDHLELMQVGLMFMKLKVEDALLEISIEKVVLLEEDLQRVLLLSCHLLALRLVVPFDMVDTVDLIVILLLGCVLDGILLSVLDLLLDEILNGVLVIKIIHLLDYRSPHGLLYLSMFDLAHHL